MRMAARGLGWTVEALLGKALEKGGLVGLAMAMAFIAFVSVVKALWNTNQAQSRQLQEERKAHDLGLREAQSSYTDQIRELQQEYVAAVEELQEKRVEEAKAVTDKIVANTEKLHKAIDKLSSTMETLIDLQRGSGGRR